MSKTMMELKDDDDDVLRTTTLCELFHIVDEENSITERDSYVLLIFHSWAPFFSVLKSRMIQICPMCQEEYLGWIVAIDLPM